MSPSKNIDLQWDFAAGVYQRLRLEIQAVLLVFLTQLCALVILPPSPSTLYE
jgi:hypothetical protein